MSEATNEVGNQLRLDLLREALPYIQRFKGQTFVVKLSGKATEDPENLSSIAEELALLHQVGIRICVVHGGGKQLSDLASMMGIKQTIINGRRVTDDATLEYGRFMHAERQWNSKDRLIEPSREIPMSLYQPMDLSVKILACLAFAADEGVLARAVHRQSFFVNPADQA